MYKIMLLIYRVGRRSAYTKIITDLERLHYKLPKSRESQIIGNDIIKLIAQLKADRKDDDNV